MTETHNILVHSMENHPKTNIGTNILTNYISDGNRQMETRMTPTICGADMRHDKKVIWKSEENKLATTSVTDTCHIILMMTTCRLWHTEGEIFIYNIICTCDYQFTLNLDISPVGRGIHRELLFIFVFFVNLCIALCKSLTTSMGASDTMPYSTAFIPSKSSSVTTSSNPKRRTRIVSILGGP